MAWTVEFARSVEKDLRRLGVADRERILTFLLERVATHPNPKVLAQKLQGKEWEDQWRFRVGHYRIIAEFIDQRLIVMVLEINHRGAVYR